MMVDESQNYFEAEEDKSTKNYQPEALKAPLIREV